MPERRTCRVCGREFHVPPCLVRRGGGLTCSRACKYASPEWREMQSKRTTATMTKEHRARLSLIHTSIERHKVPGWFHPSSIAAQLRDSLPQDWECEVALSVGPVRVAIADLLHVPTRTVVEVDGPEHKGLGRSRKDRARDARLQDLGWRVLRFSHEQVLSGEAREAILQGSTKQ